MESRRWIGCLAVIVLLALGPAANSQPDRIRVGILVYDGVFNTEFIAPLDVFDHAATHTGGRMEVFTVSPRSGTVTTAEGLRILPQYSFSTAPAIDWLVVPSGENYLTDIKDQALVDWIRKTSHRAQVVHSNCWGAFLLGAAGALDGRQATTFPASLDQFAQLFPRVQVVREAELVDDANVVTTAGGVVSYDGALYLVEKILGVEVARRVAGGFVIDWDARREALKKVVLRQR